MLEDSGLLTLYAKIKIENLKCPGKRQGVLIASRRNQQGFAIIDVSGDSRNHLTGHENTFVMNALARTGNSLVRT